MTVKVLKQVTAATFVALSLLAAPAAFAQPRGDIPLGVVIASQGNHALQVIRAEVREALRSWKPQIQAPQPEPASRRQAGVPGLAATARCAG